jgi:hypothetical protein
MDHARFLADVAGVRPPRRLDALLAHLAGGAAPIASPDDRGRVHPLVIPLTRDGDDVTGLLRWPTPPDGFELPLVRAQGVQLLLLARSTDEYLKRELAFRERAGERTGGLWDAVNRDEVLLAPGEVRASKLPFNAWLLLHGGVTHGFFEELVAVHLDRGDPQAARITAERSTRVADGWARPYAFLAELYAKLGDPRELVRDAARAALTEPLWTLGSAFGPIARLAGWTDPITSEPFRALAAREDLPILDRAARELDVVAIDGDPAGWDAIRGVLADRYAAAGLDRISRFVG